MRFSCQKLSVSYTERGSKCTGSNANEFQWGACLLGLSSFLCFNHHCVTIINAKSARAHETHLISHCQTFDRVINIDFGCVSNQTTLSQSNINPRRHRNQLNWFSNGLTVFNLVYFLMQLMTDSFRLIFFCSKRIRNAPTKHFDAQFWNLKDFWCKFGIRIRLNTVNLAKNTSFRCSTYAMNNWNVISTNGRKEGNSKSDIRSASPLQCHTWHYRNELDYHILMGLTGNSIDSFYKSCRII